jgi:hypothetical protein
VKVYHPTTLAELGGRLARASQRFGGSSYGSSSRSTGGSKPVLSPRCCKTSQRPLVTSGGMHFWQRRLSILPLSLTSLPRRGLNRGS